jgi:hypothetical protein
MKGIGIALLAALMLAACRPAAEESPAQPEQPSQPAAVPELAGEYRVAGVDGSDIDLPHAITASIDEERIHLVSDCVNLAWTYRFEGARLATETAAVEGCARGLEPAEQALLAAFDVADAVRRTPANALEFSGGGHSVTLFSQ